MTPLIITFGLYIFIIFCIGYLAVRRNKTLADYVLGGRSLSGPVAALGAGASDMSSWLLLALPGAFLVNGMNQIWLPIGLCLGAYLNWQLISKKLRIYTQIAGDSLTVPSYLHHRFEDKSHLLKTLTALVILVFFTFYASASFVSIGLLFHSMFGMAYLKALYLGGAIILIYTIVGGFLAISWIDFFQGSLVFLALLIVPASVLYALNGIHPTLALIQAQGTQYFNVFYHMDTIGILSLLAWGLGYFGQPHILVRFMAARTPNALPQAQFICMTWMVLSLFGAIFTGFFAIAYFAHSPLSNPETAFLYLAQDLFNPWITGILLAAVLSANMSTTSAQLLASSSAITEDFYHTFFRRKASEKELILIGRLGVLIVGLIAFYLARDPENHSILKLVAHAWAGLGAAFGPVILISLFWKRMTRNGAFAGMFIGAITVIAWPHFAVLKPMYELIPGFAFGCLAIGIFSLTSQSPSESIHQQFHQVKRLNKNR